MASNRIPKTFFSREVSMCLLTMEKTNAVIHPPIIPGSNLWIFSLPCFHRKQDVASAVGRKNSRLYSFACSWGMFRTRVSHSINRLPPPAPSPAKIPKTVAIPNATGKDANINIESLPIELSFPGFCEAILWVSFCQINLPVCRRLRFLINKVICRQGRIAYAMIRTKTI